VSAVTVEFNGRTAVGLRYILPLCAEAVRHADLDGSSDTTEMLDGAARAIDAALPPELRGVIPDHEEAERRMDVIDAQRKAGVRPEPRVPLSEVKEALEATASEFETEADAIEAEMNAEATEGHMDGFLRRRQFETLRGCATRLREQIASLPSTDSEGRG